MTRGQDQAWDWTVLFQGGRYGSFSLSKLLLEQLWIRTVLLLLRPQNAIIPHCLEQNSHNLPPKS